MNIETLDRVVVWNTHNSKNQDRGTTKLNVIALKGGKEVWRREAISLAWSPTSDPFVSIFVPVREFDRIRIEATEWVNWGPGLSEVQVFRGGRNIAYHRPVTANGTLDNNPLHVPEKLTDGITNSMQFGTYWCSPNKQIGWAEIQLSN